MEARRCWQEISSSRCRRIWCRPRRTRPIRRAIRHSRSPMPRPGHHRFDHGRPARRRCELCEQLCTHANRQREPAGALNQLAQGLANSVNTTLGGNTPLFQYSAGNATNIAHSLQVSSSFTTSSLAGALAANTNVAANLAGIASGSTAATQITAKISPLFWIPPPAMPPAPSTSSNPGLR